MVCDFVDRAVNFEEIDANTSNFNLLSDARGIRFPISIIAP